MASFTDPHPGIKVSWEEKGRIQIPPFRERREDIYGLTGHRIRIGKPAGTFTDRTGRKRRWISFHPQPSPVLYPGKRREKKY